MHNHWATIVDGPFVGTFSVSRRPWMLLVIGAVLLVAAATPVAAEPITVPTSLSPGDQYRLAFVTSGERDASSLDISVYNTFVDDLAELVPELAALNQDWKVIGSAGNFVHARDNTSTVPTFLGGSLGVPIFLLNDTKLVDSNDDLWDGQLDIPLSITEEGNPRGGGPAGVFVWTGTSTIGQGQSVLGNNRVRVGTTVTRFKPWIDAFLFNNPGELHSFYAISGVLSVPGAVVPEPGSFILMSIGAVGLMGFVWIRKRKRASESS